MTLDEYQNEATRTAGTVTDLRMPALGLAGEAGEFVELVKKAYYHSKTLDGDLAVKELGDVLWYVAVAAATMGVSLDTVAELNVQKLRERYPDGFVPGGGIR